PLQAMGESLQPERPEQMKWPDHPVVCTFAATLPFPLGLMDGGVHEYQLTAPFEDPASNALFPTGPFVRIRIHNAMLGGLQFEPVTTESALKALYGKDVANAVAGLIPGEAYEQWVSLETPSPRLRGENPDDAAYHFHRCLSVLDLFLRSHNLAFRNVQVYPTSTEEMGYVIFIGQYELSGEWSFFNSMLNRPERMRDYRRHQADPDRERGALAWAFRQLTEGHPFVTAVGFALRAQRFHRFHGDRVDFVISLQTAMESRFFSTLFMLLVYPGKSASQNTQAVSADTPFKSLTVTVLPNLIGGHWDIAAQKTPVGAYWQY